MNISEYRDQFASFNSSLELARYQYQVGLISETNADEIYDRYGDLFSSGAISEVRKFLDAAPTGFATEVKGLERLLGALESHHVQLKIHELTAELGRCKSASRVHWMGESLALETVPGRLAMEADSKRRELGARWLEAISFCDGLRLNWRDAVSESARDLGFASYYELRSKISNTIADKIEQTARLLLEQTESAYRAALTRLVQREIPSRRLKDLDYADLPSLLSASWLDEYLPPAKLVEIAAKTVRGLGIRMDQQTNLHIESISHQEGRNPVRCFPVQPPAEVKLTLLRQGGAADFLNGLHEFGVAQHFAWCSVETARRHPEFTFSSDSATADGFGYLFRYLALDARWLLEFIPEIESARAAAIVSDVTAQLALRLRRLCAAVLFEPLVFAAEQSLEQLQANYVSLNEGATSFSMRPELALLNLEQGGMPGCHLRALAFSFGLREYFRVRFGYRWWASRKAGDELIDLWSTASQYSVEELAALIGFGELNFDLLSETIKSTPAGA